MNKSKLLGGVTVLLSITVLAQPAWGNWAMACNGQRCGGDGGHDYVYIVRNISGGSLTLTSVCVGTEDGTALNYGFVNPPGFTATVVANDGTLPCNLVMDTDQTFTAHKTAHPPTTASSSSLIRWSGGAVVPDQAEITFAYTHTAAPWDVRWDLNTAELADATAASGSPVACTSTAPEPGCPTDGYIHSPSSAPGSSVVFQGNLNTPLGNATLDLVAGTLVVNNIGSSGLDGVRVFKPVPAESVHEEWEDLGIVATADVDTGGTLPVGASMSVQSSATSSGGSASASTDITKGSVTITPDFSDYGATTVTYEVYNAGVLVDSVTGQDPTINPVAAGDFPNRFAFSELNWATPVLITLPGSTAVTGNEVHIIPESPSETILQVHSFDLTAKDIPTITITLESFAGAVHMPALPWWGLATLVVLMLTLGTYLLRRLRTSPGFTSEG